jgi:hypothetical protein
VSRGGEAGLEVLHAGRHPAPYQAGGRSPHQGRQSGRERPVAGPGPDRRLERDLLAAGVRIVRVPPKLMAYVRDIART